MAKQKALYQFFNLGGISDSLYMGIENSHPRMVGLNIHDEPGVIKANQKFTKNSGTTITEFCKVAFKASNGIRYWFSSESGKIWQDKAGTYSLVYTVSPAAGEAKILSAREYNGYIYFTTELRLHRIAVGSADGSAAWTANAAPNWQTFAVGNKNFHPLEEVNLILYIGDGYQVHQIENNTYTANAVDLPTHHVITDMTKNRVWLIIGTQIGTTYPSPVNQCSLFWWNTYSVSFSQEDTLEENGINAFIRGDNYILVSAGRAGVLYVISGDVGEVYKRIPGDYSPTKTGIVHPGSTAIWKGYPIFGFSNVSGNPADQGIYSLARHSAGYKIVLNLEFPTDVVDGEGYPTLTGVEIGAIIVDGTDLYIARKVGSDVGVAKLDYTAKIAKPYIEFRALFASPRTILDTFTKFSACYKELPASTSVAFKYRTNLASSFNSLDTSVDDTQRSCTYAERAIEATKVQLRAELLTSANSSPVIELFYID